MIDFAVTFEFVLKRLARSPVQDPIDGFGEEADPVATEVHVGFLAGQQEELLAGKARTLLIQRLKHIQSFIGFLPRCPAVMELRKVNYVDTRIFELPDKA